MVFDVLIAQMKNQVDLASHTIDQRYVGIIICFRVRKKNIKNETPPKLSIKPKGSFIKLNQLRTSENTATKHCHLTLQTMTQDY